MPRLSPLSVQYSVYLFLRSSLLSLGATGCPSVERSIGNSESSGNFGRVENRIDVVVDIAHAVVLMNIRKYGR